MEEEGNSKREEAKYESKMLTCTRCGAKQETKEMQLKVCAGLRAIHCNENCGKQERVIKNRCSCDVIWHQCPLHRIDPPFHTSRRGAKRGRGETEETGKKARLQSSTRQAPEVVDVVPTAMKAQAKKREGQLNNRKLEAAKPNRKAGGRSVRYW